MNRKKFICKRDNLKIVGYEYREKEGKLPAVILSHGFMANQSMCRTYAKLIAGLGYAAFTFDFNGGGLMNKSSGKTVDMTVETEVADLKAVVKYVKSLDYIDAENITLLGCSQGGVVSALVAKDKEYAPSKLILIYPALCIPDDARKGKMMFAKFDPNNIPKVILRFPMKLGGNYARCVMDWTWKDIVGGFDGRVLYIHGTEDKIVNIDYARQAKDEYSDVEYHEIEGGGHMFKGEHDVLAQRHIAEFLR